MSRLNLFSSKNFHLLILLAVSTALFASCEDSEFGAESLGTIRIQNSSGECVLLQDPEKNIGSIQVCEKKLERSFPAGNYHVVALGLTSKKNLLDQYVSVKPGEITEITISALVGSGPEKDPQAPVQDPNADAIYTLELQMAGSAFGTVTVNGEPCIKKQSALPAPCFFQFKKGTEVSLKATAGENSIFVLWSGDTCFGGSSTCFTTMQYDQRVVASFSFKPICPFGGDKGGIHFVDFAPKTVLIKVAKPSGSIVTQKIADKDPYDLGLDPGFYRVTVSDISGTKPVYYDTYVTISACKTENADVLNPEYLQKSE